jgi:hypothetical protein
MTSTSEIDPFSVQDHPDLVRYLSQAITPQYRTGLETGEVRQHSTYVKRYILELPHETTAKQFRDFLKQFGNVRRTKEESLFHLSVYDTNDAFFFDFADRRFVAIHSIADAQTSDTLFDRLASGGSLGTDRAWITSEMMYAIFARRGRLTGFKLDHDARIPELLSLPQPHENSELLSPKKPRRRFPGLKVEVSGTFDAERELHELQSADLWRGRKAIQRIEFREAVKEVRSENSPGYVSHATSSLYSQGKMVGYGTSIDLFLLAGNFIQHTYSAAIERIESEFSIKWSMSASGVTRLTGGALEVEFPDDVRIESLEDFIGAVFTSQPPFRVMRLRGRASDSRIDFEAIDLHTKHRFSVEATRQWLRFYVPEGTCGNVIARLGCNLQHFVHSDLIVKSLDGQPAFGRHGSD